MMQFLSLFSGIGGFDLGLERAGMECACQVECDKHCNAVLARHWPDVERHSDVRTFEAAEPVRLICGGFPCQDLSVAGLRAGLAGKRSGLWHEFRRIIAAATPRWVLIENVPGLLSSQNGLDMGIVVWSLGQLGYGWAYRVLDAQWFGVPQRRRRVFIVGCLADRRRAVEVLFERESLPWDSPPSREARTGVAHCLARGAGSHGRYDPNGEDYVTHPSVGYPLKAGGNLRHDESHDTYVVQSGAIPLDMRQLSRGEKFTNNRRDGGPPGTGIGEAGGPSPSLAASHPPGVAFQKTGACVRRLLPVECERLQGFPDGWTEGLSDAARYRCLGNAVAVPVAEWLGKRIMSTEANVKG